MHVRNPLLVHYLLWLALVGEIIDLPLGLQLAYDRAHLQDRRALLSQESVSELIGPLCRCQTEKPIYDQYYSVRLIAGRAYAYVSFCP